MADITTQQNVLTRDVKDEHNIDDGLNDTRHANKGLAMDLTELSGPSRKREFDKDALTADKVSELFDRTPLVITKTNMSSSNSHATLSSAREEKINERIGKIVTPESSKRSLSVSSNGEAESSASLHSSQIPDEAGSFSRQVSSPLSLSKMSPRNRWKRAVNSVTFMNRMAASIRSASTDLVEDRAVDETLRQQTSEGDAGGVKAATAAGATTAGRSKSKGRKGMEGLIVWQDRGFITFFQDFYVTCLKMPSAYFLVGILLAPLVLGLLFTPLYLLDIDGLSFDEVESEDATTGPAKQRCLVLLNVFLYALSLSTTFGGSPVAARSPFCLMVANMNTLLAQVLFVFLSGAVFARMSQPSYPIRCSKKAIIKYDDLSQVLGIQQQENCKVFAVRLVLTGPPPCELIDAKICLTFRIFVTLPSGSVFCSTHDLELVRREVAYLRYGIMVRHVIDEKSPVHGHTIESLRKGDASFSLTVMGMERASMQPVFHVEDYFVCDDDVVWEGDYEDFVHTNRDGQRVLDHSRIDMLKPMKAAALASQAVSRMQNSKFKKGEHDKEDSDTNLRKEKSDSSHHLWHAKWPNLRKRTFFKILS